MIFLKYWNIFIHKFRKPLYTNSLKISPNGMFQHNVNWYTYCHFNTISNYTLTRKVSAFSPFCSNNRTTKPWDISRYLNEFLKCHAHMYHHPWKLNIFIIHFILYNVNCCLFQFSYHLGSIYTFCSIVP